MKKTRIISILCCIALGVVFILAAVPKILHPHDFARAVFNYHLLPHSLVNVTAVFLPWLELVAGLAIILWPAFRSAASAILLGMLVVFTIAIGLSIVRGIDIACGCFSVNAEGEHITWLNIARNLLLLGACVWVLVVEKSRSQPARS